LTENDIGKGRAASSAAKLQELNNLVKVSVHVGELTEDLVRSVDVMVMTTTNRDELVKWNNFCRNNEQISFDSRGRQISKAAPIRFIAVGGMGVLGYIFSDFGPEFHVLDQTGEPPVQRVITNITCENEGVVSLLDPSESELAKKADIADTEHEGFITFSEVEGMYSKSEHDIKVLGHSVNSSGVWRAKEIWRREPDFLLVPPNRGGDGVMLATQYWVHERDPKTGEYKKDADRPDGLYWKGLFGHECGNIPEEDFVRDENKNKVLRTKVVKDHYKLKIGDTSGYSKYLGGGIIQQTYQPVVFKHKSLATSLQCPYGINETKLLACDGDKEELGWWYPMLHVVKQGLFQFQALNNRLPEPNNESEALQVIEMCKFYNASMRTLNAFCGNEVALATLDLSIEPCRAPSKDGFSSSQLQMLEGLIGAGASEEKSILIVKALEALNDTQYSDPNDAFMVMFDENVMAKVELLESGVKVQKCLDAMKKLILAAGVEFQPIAVFMGGICAQEIVKHCGKYTPLNQWFHYDCIEVLPDVTLPAEEVQPIGSRYDNNIALFGHQVVAKLKETRTFMVGCGALGCELLKNFAMLGVACGSGGLITVTDGDRIEVSNLNRQFLFRKQHVKKAKSTTAAEAVLSMNHDIKVDALELLAMKETENIFNDSFWLADGIANKGGQPVVCRYSPKDKNGLNFVVNALDNIKARKYMDARCVYYHKPLLESGTEGTKFNHQVVIPGVTVSYDEGEPEAQEGEAIPMCTLRNFPSTIIHCIEWARGAFEDLFVSPIADFAEFLKDPKGYITNLKESAESFSLDSNEIQLAKDKLSDKDGNGLIRTARWAHRVRTGGHRACVEIAHELFISKFNFSMRDLQHQFPKDYMTNGKPFWAPPKRYPTVLELDLSDEFISSFIVSVSNLLAVAFGIHKLPVNGIDANGNDYDTFVPMNSPWRSLSAVGEYLPAVTPKWAPSAIKIETEEKSNDDSANAVSSSIEDEVASLLNMLNELESIDVSEVVAQPADFEKDLDMNFHIDFVAAASNLRASNYGIPRATRHKTKMIAGKIIAAIATSTACATALVCVELIKLVQNKAKHQHRDSSCNFAVNQFQMSEPQAANVVKGRGEKRITPDPLSQPQYFDKLGNVLWDLVPVKKWQAYPDPHTKYDTIELLGSLTLEQMIGVLKFEHNLKLMSWLVTLKDENGKTTGKQIYNEPAVDTSIDEELLLQIAPLSLTQQKATIAITRCNDMKNKQAYTQRWNVLKQREGEEFKKKMATCVKDLLESYVGSLDGVSRYELELSLEIAQEPGVEAVTPPLILIL
jgi:molybdopterin/thiamine biosynthesis adenylyltransferase